MNEAIEAAIAALEENNNWHHEHDDVDGYPGSHLEAVTVGALTALKALRQNAGAADLRSLEGASPISSLAWLSEQALRSAPYAEVNAKHVHVRQAIDELSRRGLIKSHEGAGSAGEHKAALSQPENLDLPEDNR